MPGCTPRHVCVAERRLLLTYLLKPGIPLAVLDERPPQNPPSFPLLHAWSLGELFTLPNLRYATRRGRRGKHQLTVKSTGTEALARPRCRSGRYREQRPVLSDFFSIYSQ